MLLAWPKGNNSIIKEDTGSISVAGFFFRLVITKCCRTDSQTAKAKQRGKAAFAAPYWQLPIKELLCFENQGVARGCLTIKSRIS